MKVYQCGFIASQGIGVPDCSKDISSPTPNQVSVDGIELEQIYPGGWGFGLGSTKNGALYSWGVNQATLLGKSGMCTDLFS
jgi:alpha-tubulin suppressor-like RCC1 family protein